MYDKFIEKRVVCWKCQKWIKVYTWEDHEMWGRQRPPEPKPRTLQWRFSKAQGEYYWANVCEFCGMIQGDFGLYMADGAVFSDKDDNFSGFYIAGDA